MSTSPVIKVERLIRNDEGPVKAYVDLLILDTFIVKGLEVLPARELGLGEDGLCVGMPVMDGQEIFYPISREMRQGLQELILEAYEEQKPN